MKGTALEAVRRGPSNTNFSKIAFPNVGFSRKKLSKFS
jgi:hypothetical protein